jgi:hypothetical protein
VRYRPLLIAAAVLIGIPLTAPIGRAAEPQVEFEVKDGWVEFVLTRDDKPVPDATVLVFDSGGNKFAEGETGAQGRGLFPLPPGAEFRVEFKVDGRNADMIRLAPVDGRVVPNRVLLSFGLAPCCRTPSRAAVAGSAAPPPEPVPFLNLRSVWLQAGAGVALTLVGVVILGASRRGSPHTPKALQ